MKKTIKIHYAIDETGPAELLGKRLARIVDDPVLTDQVMRNDIVRLDRGPNDPEGFPRIAEVLYTPYPEKTYISFNDLSNALLLQPILAILGAEACLVYPPHDGKPGTMLIGHPHGIDPAALADAIGIRQENDGDAEFTHSSESKRDRPSGCGQEAELGTDSERRPEVGGQHEVVSRAQVSRSRQPIPIDAPSGLYLIPYGGRVLQDLGYEVDAEEDRIVALFGAVWQRIPTEDREPLLQHWRTDPDRVTAFLDIDGERVSPGIRLVDGDLVSLRSAASSRETGHTLAFNAESMVMSSDEHVAWVIARELARIYRRVTRDQQRLQGSFGEQLYRLIDHRCGLHPDAFASGCQELREEYARQVEKATNELAERWGIPAVPPRIRPHPGRVQPAGSSTAAGRGAGCPRCSVTPGTLHVRGCSAEQCPYCGGQLLSCACPAIGSGEVPEDDRLPWSGVWPGIQECQELGWYAQRNPAGPGWIPCRADDPGAQPDLNRLHGEATWDRDAKRFTRG